ncbi:4'-phosphopantetheinyl transferase family protein [Streptomyces eurythermus]
MTAAEAAAGAGAGTAVVPSPARPRAAVAGVPPGPGELHVWAWPVPAYPVWGGLLTEEETAHADALPDGPARATYVGSRGLQRALGSHYLRLPARGLRIDRTCAHCGAEHGRPRFTAGAGRLDYSVAHTRDWVLAAVVSGGLVGVDVDVVPDAETSVRLARKALTERERQALAGLPEEERAAGFVRLWTRKEAGGKLAGRGLAARFDHLDAAGPTLRRAGELPDGWPSDDIHLLDLPPVGPLRTGHLASVASTRPIRRVLLPAGWDQPSAAVSA